MPQIYAGKLANDLLDEMENAPLPDNHIGQVTALERFWQAGYRAGLSRARQVIQETVREQKASSSSLLEGSAPEDER